MAYVYRHIRLDKNIPFYIGIGLRDDDAFRRAYTKHDRNSHWRAIAKKTEISVEILMDNLTWGIACEKEIEFISIYKRVVEGGSLCNLTTGGEGTRKRVNDKEGGILEEKPMAVKAYTPMGTPLGYYECIEDAADEFGIAPHAVKRVLSGNLKSYRKTVFKYAI